MTNQPEVGVQPSLRDSAKRETTKQVGAVCPLRVRGSYDVDDLNRADILFRKSRVAPDVVWKHIKPYVPCIDA